MPQLYGGHKGVGGILKAFGFEFVFNLPQINSTTFSATRFAGIFSLKGSEQQTTEIDCGCDEKSNDKEGLNHRAKLHNRI